MKKAFSVLLFGFIGISFVYEGHAMFSRTGRGLTGIMAGALRLNTLSKTVRPAASLAQSVLTTDLTSTPSGMTGPLFGSSLVPTIKMPSDMFQGQSSLLDAVKGMPTSTPLAPSASPITSSMWDQIYKMLAKESLISKQNSATDLLEHTKENSVLNGLFGDHAAPVTDFLEHTKENSVLNGLFGESVTATDVFDKESSFGLEELFRDDMTGGAMTAGSESCIAQGGGT